MTEVVFKPFAKIFHLGHRNIKDIWNSTVEITEKVDGSQFGFGKINGEVVCRSRGRMIDMDNPDKLFEKAVEQVQRISKDLPDNYAFYGEYLQRPKHNVIKYDRVPKNHIMLFGLQDLVFKDFKYDYGQLEMWANIFSFDCAPVLTPCKSDTYFDELLKKDSYLGGSKIEGFVVKNWTKAVMLYDQIWWPMSGKYVSEAFKERNSKAWSDKKPKNNWEAYKESYRAEARWEKAVQHLRENGNLQGAPEDIGALIKEVHRDIIEEDEDEIKEKLWKLFGKDLTRAASRGLPEWYKRKLAEGGIEV